MKIKFIVIFCFIVFQLPAQKYFTKSGTITFSSDAPLERIEAINAKASSVFDFESGAIEWAVLIKGFEFDKALMQEHFNENYMESSKYPKAKFKGKLTGLSDIDFSQDGEYKLKVVGVLKIHGVENEVVSEAIFNVKAGQVSASSSLEVQIEDYNIEIPSVVKDNIAKQVNISIEANYQELNR